MAKQAGFNVTGIYTEPAASAVNFWYSMQMEGKKVNEIDSQGRTHILLYDLGGGTFDTVYMLLMPNGTIEMIASGGCNHLGGEDIDMAFVKRWAAELAISSG
jgi:molecular chaperone DnaK (HSP70)